MKACVSTLYRMRGPSVEHTVARLCADVIALTSVEHTAALLCAVVITLTSVEHTAARLCAVVIALTKLLQLLFSLSYVSSLVPRNATELLSSLALTGSKKQPSTLAVLFLLSPGSPHPSNIPLTTPPVDISSACAVLMKIAVGQTTIRSEAWLIETKLELVCSLEPAYEMKYFTCGVLVVLCGLVEGWKTFHHGRHKGGMLGAPYTDQQIVLPPAEWFEQKLDHFNPTDTTTWRQKYFTNATFYKPGNPVFLMIGGEGAANATWMVKGTWIDYASQLGALCFNLEHRFYGDSHPTKDMSVKNLRYLSSEQALADLAEFIEAMNNKYKLTSATKWIVFGGSYPGSLAAWLRLKYPHLIYGAVSTSGPLLAKADFQEYYGVVQESLSTTGNDCVIAIKNATSQIDILLKHEIGLLKLKELFRPCDAIDPTNEADVATLYETLAGNFAGVVQYNKDNRAFEGSRGTNITIDVVCELMSDETIGPAVTRYAAVNSLLLDAYNQNCTDFSYDNMIKSMRNTSWNSSAGEGGRQWTYQTCTEFGFYQTSSLAPHLFGDDFPLDYFTRQCEDIFGPRFNDTLLEQGMQRTNMFYGAYDLEVTNVVFVHGTIDPWHALGITKSISDSAPAIFIEGTAHCANMYPSSPDDPPGLVAARLQIFELVKQWLQED
uniref:Serine protease K12H4.7 n=1 Tax=Timema tahoe TaxID=61484 RepID=A0A7R9NUG4_9NEOP|nr:unnamed protein product [Timema tahoe]